MDNLRSCPATPFLATAKSAESLAFYRDTLGLELIEDTDFAIVFKLANGELRVSKVPGLTPFPWTVLDWQVGDIAASLSLLAGAGVDPERFPGLEYDERGVWTVPGDGTQIAWFKDPDGNVLSVSQRS